MDRYHLYIVLTRTNTLISKLIQLIKKDYFTHAAISLDKELNRMYSFGRVYSYNPFIGSFKQERINKGLYKRFDNIPAVIIEVEVTKQQYEKAKHLINRFITNKEYYKYNYIGLLYSILNRARYRNDRFLCSEFVYYILSECQIIDLNIPRNLVRPQNFLEIKCNIIYNDNLKKLAL
jgi:hypothetical protein